MGICLILIPRRPEKRSNSTCTLNCSIWQIQCHYHRLIDFGLQTDNMGCEGLGMLCILLKTWQSQLLVWDIPNLYLDPRSWTHISRMPANCTTPLGSFGGANAPYKTPSQLLVSFRSRSSSAQSYPSVEIVLEFVWCQRMLFYGIQAWILRHVSF